MTLINSSIEKVSSIRDKRKCCISHCRTYVYCSLLALKTKLAPIYISAPEEEGYYYFYLSDYAWWRSVLERNTTPGIKVVNIFSVYKAAGFWWRSLSPVEHSAPPSSGRALRAQHDLVDSLNCCDVFSCKDIPGERSHTLGTGSLALSDAPD